MIEVVLCTDDNYVMPTGVLMTSIERANTDESIRYHIVTLGLTEKSCNQLRESALKSTVEFHVVDKNNLANCPVRPGEHISIATYFRLLLPSILSADISKVLYIDGDILCVDSLRDLYDTDLEGCSAAAAIDMRSKDSAILNRLSLSSDSEYLNAGVMLINMDWWRSHNVQNKALKFIAENPDVCLFHDQDALNVVLAGSMKRVSVRYNYQEHFFEPLEKQPIAREHWDDVECSRNELCLVHFTGRKKPWHRECINPLKNLWIAYYKKSLWGDIKLGYKYSGLKRARHILRKKLVKLGLVRDKNIYKNLDFSNLMDELEQKYL